MWRDVPLTSLLVVLLAPLLLACGDDGPTDVPDELEGGMLATFRVQSDTFRVWTDRPGAMASLEALASDGGAASIPNAPLLRGPGRADHNEPWSWHLHPEALEIVAVAAEVCDGRPSFVEEELDYWIDDVGRYCPWSAELVDLEDYR